MAGRKVLIIGIDGAVWEVLRPAVNDGFMPCLAGLMDAGSWGVLESTLPAITPAAWVAFQTGLNPGRTGIFDFFGWDPELRKQVPADIRKLPTTVWEAAGEAGRRVGIVNLPMTYPPHRVNGFLVSGLLTPSTDSEFTYPRSLARDLLEAIPGYHIFNLETAVDDTRHESLDAFLDWISEVVIQRSRAACWLLEREPVDLFMIHFQASDILQHVLWAHLDPAHERFDAALHQKILERFYRTIDRQMSLISDTFGRASPGPWITMVVSDHGFQRHLKRFNLWRWLFEEGYLYLDLARSYQAPDESRTGSDEEYREDPPIDWERSRAIASGRSNEAFIYLLEGSPHLRRETSDELITRLGEVRDPENGSHIIKAVHRREEIYYGEFLHLLPDLVVEPAGGYSITGRYQHGEPELRMVVAGEDFHIGRHHPEGIFVAAGPGIRKNHTVRARIIDIAPTLNYLLGVPPQEVCDGRVLDELFTEDFLAGQPVPITSETVYEADTVSPEPARESVYTPEEEATIKRRLQELGYM